VILITLTPYKKKQDLKYIPKATSAPTRAGTTDICIPRNGGFNAESDDEPVDLGLFLDAILTESLQETIKQRLCRYQSLFHEFTIKLEYPIPLA
jgi:hypothetical protein